MTLAVGQPAKDFTLPTDTGAPLTLSQLRGQAVVLYFYPKDDTSGCTKESQDFSALMPAFEAANTRVIGISRCSIESHKAFRAKRALSVDLCSDDTGAMTQAYGVWGEKSMYGRKYMGIIRTTVLIDAAGIITHIWPKVSVTGHAAAVLKAAQALHSSG